jgi:hypothetical protein
MIELGTLSQIDRLFTDADPLPRPFPYCFSERAQVRCKYRSRQLEGLRHDFAGRLVTALPACASDRTSSSRSIVFDREGHIVALAQQELTQKFYPQPGKLVEHDPR